MPRNVELKARLRSLTAARQTAKRLATQHLGVQQQTDTFFPVPRGRLKLREIEGQAAQLIAYHRTDASEPRSSDYVLAAVPDAAVLKQALAAVLGASTIVQKRREIFLYHCTRIHLDDVEGLGEFLELEAVLGESLNEEEAHTQLRWLMDQFGLTPDDIVPQAYADLCTMSPTSL